MSNDILLASQLVERPDQFFIGGQWVDPISAEKIEVVTPSTEQTFGRFAEAGVADVDRAVAAARDAFDNGPWPLMSPAERADHLRALSRELVARSSTLSSIWSAEVGVTRGVADAIVPGLAGVFDYHADMASTYPFIERHVPQGGGEVGLLVREPVGVVGAIVAWNGALGLIVWKVAPALLAGCTVVIKASPESPGSAWLVAEAAAAAGIPAGVINIVLADRDVSERLVRHPGVDKITFTGSSGAGKKIAAICGERIARCTLELGGKSAALILDDYDLETAARSISASARILTGQVCSSLTRLIVSRDRHDAFVEALSAAFAEIKVGDPFDLSTDMGPLASRRQKERVEGFITSGLSEGALLACGGRRPDHLDRGFFIAPTVFGKVDNDMRIAREEIFGPVVSVIAAEDDRHAIRIANDTPFGLNASVFTNDATRTYRIARKIRSGTVGQNSFRTDFSIAFGGFKESGIGREGGAEGMRAFLEAKTIILDGEPELG